MKERLDVLLVKKGLAPSREQAKATIMSGIVFVAGQREDKAGAMFDENAQIEVRGQTLKYVSRGGLKLEKAMSAFALDLRDKVCMDVGASTGGFTDCMLMNGAKKVYAVDVGYGQLAWKLRQDPRVVCMEKTNIRYVTAEQIEEPAEFVSIDVSFISLTKVLGPVRELMTPNGEVVCLIKPQFEAGREKVGKKGVVRDKAVHLEVIRGVIAYASANGFWPLHLDYSPVKGPEGNIEYLLHLRKSAENVPEKSGAPEENEKQPEESGSATKNEKRSEKSGISGGDEKQPEGSGAPISGEGLSETAPEEVVELSHMALDKG
ncbi:MAG: TlyA family RNA methyltransferase [Lachnospiraceae bacterium]|nr:TlyA family RNA methyltransferase [Lachnospiraceae bacterium]